MTGKMERVPYPTRSGPSSTGTGLLLGEPSLPLGVADEYNPLVPNDYEELARQRREKRKADVSRPAGQHAIFILICPPYTLLLVLGGQGLGSPLLSTWDTRHLCLKHTPDILPSIRYLYRGFRSKAVQIRHINKRLQYKLSTE
ncbi:unnamed protein product [Schistocephalus solidus]|uniref:NADH dehydrogenase [ubiquinone] 1 alpha subcomplex subunit 13 n=1 Tax=Schistocephalus solidus TaxID=70667 RepID=A0A183SCM9_SCHSO|nr:unnamed protein product [Schistocephalus solidus]